ncbi:unnamed protein product [Coregonus sp. 'balchen']|nr:unnamed protein product [Coregonus sp. 'balchen']
MFIPSLSGWVEFIPSLSGWVEFIPSLSGWVEFIPSLSGWVEFIPSLSGWVEFIPSLSGWAEFNPSLSGWAEFNPSLSGWEVFIPSLSGWELLVYSPPPICLMCPGDASMVEYFYGNVGNGKGEQHSRSSYLPLRSGLNRFLNDPPIGRSWCLMKDTEFTTSNHVFLGNIKQLRRQGKYITNSHPPITDKDMSKLQNCQALNPGTPTGLVQKVWFHLQLHLGQRGKEGNRQLKANSFLGKTDENGLRYATLAYNEATKNNLYPRERGRESKRGFIFEQPGNPLCPVA